MSSLALSSPVLSSSSVESHPFPHSSLLCCRSFDGVPARCLARASAGPRSLLLPSCFELASPSRCPKILAGLDCRSGHRNRTRASAADENAPGSEETSSSRTTVEQGKRILALQKDLLDQIAERKKLVTALKDNLGHAAEQVKAYNNSEARSSESDFSQDEPMPDIVGSGSSPVWDVSSVGNKADTGAQYDAALKMKKTKLDVKTSSSIPLAGTERQSGFNSESGRKAFESEIKSVSPASLADIFSSSKSSGVSSPVQSPPPLGVKKKVSFIEEQKSSPDEPAVATSSSSSLNEAAPPLAGQNVMNVILAAAECYPWSKTGGLGDVAGALPRALARRGHRVMVVAPRYRSYPEAWDTKIRKRYNIAGQEMEVGYFHGFIDGVDHVFIDNSNFHGFADNIYGGNREDVLKRMALFCKAAIEVPWHVPCGGVCYGDGNLAFIANDWHTALLPVYLQAYYRDNGLMNFARSILVIHNIAHQGRGPLSDFSLLGLPDHYIDKFRLYDPIGGEHSNVFMAGLLTAHRIVAVSHGYAWECQTQLGGWGLDGVVREHNWKLRGIVNGIDDKEWSPELDIYLQTDGYSNYSTKTLHSGKALCKAALQKELGLPVRDDVPLIGFIGRLDHQKGVDIIADAMHWMMEQDLQLVLLGTGRADLENMLHNFENQHRHKVRAWVGFSVKTAHRITAGSDILVMPSRFEPCGLNQLYAMRYGTVPVVHAVGGLRDTVITFDPYSNTGTGWTFSKAEASELIHALGNAMWTFHDFKESWRGIQERGMTQDLSWDQAAKQYEEVMVAAKYQW